MKMPPSGVSSPAPTSILSWPACAAEDAPRHGPALDHRGEDHRALVVERGGPEAGEDAPGGRGVALGDDLAECPRASGPRQIDRLDRLAAATDGRQERDVAAVVERRGVEAGERARRQCRAPPHRRAPPPGSGRATR